MTRLYATLTDDGTAFDRMEAEPFHSPRRVHVIRADAHLSAASTPSPATPSVHLNEAGCAPTRGPSVMADYAMAAVVAFVIGFLVVTL